jgi:hypothetical protein
VRRDKFSSNYEKLRKGLSAIVRLSRTYSFNTNSEKIKQNMARVYIFKKNIQVEFSLKTGTSTPLFMSKKNHDSDTNTILPLF